MRAVSVVGVLMELPSTNPVLILRENDGDERELHIPIGFPEATSIAAALRGVQWPRPVTHELMAEVLGEFDIQVEQAVISGVRERTFYAHLDLVRAEERRVVSCRPSDAVGLLLRLPGAGPLLVVDEVMDREGIRTRPPSEPPAEAPEPSSGGPPDPGSDPAGGLVGHADQDGQQDVVGHQGGPAVGDEGQGHTRDRQEPDHAGHDEERLEPEDGGEPGHQQLGEVRP